MSTAKKELKHKHLRIDEAKLMRAQKLLGAHNATETIESALDAVLAERERNRRARAAHERFTKSGIEIRDVFGRLEGE